MEMVKQSITYARAAMKVSTQAVAEGELTPPSALPPIAEILAIDGRASAIAQAYEDKLAIDGSVTLSVLYVCVNGRVHGFESLAYFKHNVDLPGCTPQMRCRVSPVIGEISRHLAAGTVNVRSQIRLDCTCEENTEVDIVSNVNGAESKTVVFRAAKRTEIKSEMTLREDIRLPRSAEKLLGISGYGRVQSIGMEVGKAIVEGVLRLNLTFCTPDGTLLQAPASLPISQRVALSEDVGEASVQIRVLTLSAALADEDIATVDSQIEINLQAETRREYEMLSDAYSTNLLLECVRVNIPLRETMNINSRSTLRQTINVPAGMPAADRVLITLLRPIIEKIQPNEGTLSLEGTLRCGIVYLCRDGNLHGFESAEPFACEGEAAGLRQHMDVNVDVACELVHAGAAGMEIPLQTALDVAIEASQSNELSLVSNIEESERSERTRGLLVYFPDEGEGLWEIGKRFGMGIDDLRELNPEASDNPQSVVLKLR